MKRLHVSFLLATLAITTLVFGPAGADDPSPPDPNNRVEAWTPRPAGTRSTIVLQYGPYVVHPGSDLSRVDVEVALLDGFVVAAQPAVRLADGTEPPDSEVHIHHAHWVKLRPQGGADPNGWLSWFFGTGEEKTRGSAEDVAKTDPRYAQGLRYGVPVARGERMAFVSMLHNKTARPLVLWLEGRFEFVHGSRDEIRLATGEDFRPLTPVLHGATLQVPRTGSLYTWPRDARAGEARGSIVPGVGHLWTAPWDGTIVIGAGHLHPGGREVIVSNLGQRESPCGPAWLSDPDGDGVPGKTIQRIQAYYPNDVFPSEGYQMGVTKRAWRAPVRKGDQIAINGSYDATEYAYPDAMSFFGFYADLSEPPGAGEACSARLVNRPDASSPDVVMSMPNRDWHADPVKPCSPCDDPSQPAPAKGPHARVVHIAAFLYEPGDRATLALTGAPWVRKGESITFVNEDYAAGLVRHSVTSCRAPCNGPYAPNYPFHDGAFDSGAMGWTPIDTYQIKQDVPAWTLDTSSLAPGYYAYYCRLHTWMRGSFHVEPAA